MAISSEYLQINPTSVKIIGGIGGIALFIVSIMSCFAVFNSFLSPLAYIQNVFFLLFGIIITIVSIWPNSSISTTIYDQAGFMSTLQGRGTFFLYLGALLFGSGLSGSSPSWTYLLIGSWLIFASVIYFIQMCRGGSSATLTDSASTSKV